MCRLVVRHKLAFIVCHFDISCQKIGGAFTVSMDSYWFFRILGEDPNVGRSSLGLCPTALKGLKGRNMSAWGPACCGKAERALGEFDVAPGKCAVVSATERSDLQHQRRVDEAATPRGWPAKISASALLCVIGKPFARPIAVMPSNLGRHFVCPRLRWDWLSANVCKTSNRAQHPEWRISDSWPMTEVIDRPILAFEPARLFESPIAAFELILTTHKIP